MVPDHLCQVCSNNGWRIDNGISKAFRSLPLALCDPDRRQMEGWLKGRNTSDLFLYIPWIHRHIMVKEDLSLCHLDTLDLNNILVRIQLDIITQTDDRHNRTKFQGDLSTDHDNTVKKVATLIDICQQRKEVREDIWLRYNQYGRNEDQRLSDLSWILLRSLPGSERRSRTNFQGYSDV